MSSRFWMLRKHFNCMSSGELQSVPYHSWNFITLILEHRDVDLVIRDDKDMDLLLKFLIHRLYTLDGSCDSARPLLEAMQKQGQDDYMKKNNKKFFSKSTEALIKQRNEHNLFRKVHLKYLIMRIRAKISFMAL